MKQSEARKKIRAARAAKKKKLAEDSARKRKRLNKKPTEGISENSEQPQAVPPKRFRRNSNKKNTIVMFSSGLDSTAALYWMLENTDDNIFVHRIVLDNKEKRSNAESAASSKVIRWLRKHCRNFEYKESYYSYSGYTPYDMYVYMYMAGIRGLELKNRRRGGVDRVVTGSIKMYRRNTGVEKRREKAWKIFGATYGGKSVDWFKPLIDHTKEQVFNYLPKDLSDLTWSCRRPKGSSNTKECGRCHSCMAMKRVRGQLSATQIRRFRGWNE